MLRTKIDDLLDLLGKQKRISLQETSKKLKWNVKSLEKVAQFLDRLGLIRLHYPLNVFVKPWVELLSHPPTPELSEPKGKSVERYPVKGLEGHVQAEVKIIHTEKEKRSQYHVLSEHVSTATWMFFELIKDDITRKLPLEKREKDKGETTHQDLQIRHEVISSMVKELLETDPKDLELLCGLLLREMYGLGNVEILLADAWLEEIVINSAQLPLSVYHRKYGWLKSNILVESEEDTENYAAQIARKVGKQISLLNPILDAHLLSGDRVNATLKPVSSQGNTLTLRLFARSPWTITRFLYPETKALTIEIAALLWQAMHYEMNMIVSGGTASGKTYLLNSIVSLIQPFQRIVSIEDTRELSLPSYQWNWVPLVTRAPNPEGLGEVTMLDLVVNSLRMRPDRIVMGEVRRKHEAEVLFEAMHTGHSVYATFHADTASQVVKRLTEPPIEVPASEVEDIHLVLVQYRDRRKNIRRLFEVAEVSPGPRGPELNYIYVWKARTDTFQAVKQPSRYTEQLNLHTGMTEREQFNDRKDKASVLQWMINNKLEEVDQIGSVMRAYYADSDSVVKAAEKKWKPDKVL